MMLMNPDHGLRQRVQGCGQNRSGGDRMNMGMQEKTGTAQAGGREPSASFHLAVSTLDMLMKGCLELFPDLVMELFDETDWQCTSIRPRGQRELPAPFEPYSVRSEDYLVDLSWNVSGEGKHVPASRRYQVMCEETPRG